MSNFENVEEAARIYIQSLDQPSVKVVAQYNPKELQIDKSVPWSKVNDANKSNSKSTSGQGIHLEFTGAEGRSMQLELLFDGVEGGNRKVDVVKSVKDLETLASVINPGSKQEDERRPHRCVVAWGSTLDNFRCVIESLSTKYTMFDDQGAPLRATCTVKLKEADVVSMGKAK
jgi:hypothetical protein